MLRFGHRSLISLLLLLIGIYGVLGLYLNQGKVLGARHAPVRNYPEFDFASGTLAQYTDYIDAYLRSQRTSATDDTVVANLLPFLLEPDASCPRTEDGRYASGIVLTHGLIDSPYSMRPLGEALQARCFLVYGLILPDHGSRPGAMLDSTWQRWAAAEHWAAQRIGGQVQTLLLAGHSVGGTLAVLESARNPRVDALVLFAPALAISEASKYARFISPLGGVFAGAGWFEVDQDEALYRYESFPFAAATQTWDLVQTTWQQERGTHRNLPVFTVASLPDNTVGTPAILDYMAANTNPASATLLFSQHDYPAAPRLTVVNSAQPDNGILSASHLGLMTPPGHPYYGLNGEYRNCEHYGSAADDSFSRCKAGARNYYGEPTEENLASGLIERIAFNPQYPLLLDHLDAFLARLGLLESPSGRAPGITDDSTRAQ